MKAIQNHALGTRRGLFFGSSRKSVERGLDF